MNQRNHPPRLMTSAYWTVPAGVQPVRTSRGVPPKFRDVPALWSAAPTRQLFDHWNADGYLTLLDSRATTLIDGVDALLAEFHAIALCCFEPDPADCHRSLLAEWLIGQGVPVEAIR